MPHDGTRDNNTVPRDHTKNNTMLIFNIFPADTYGTLAHILEQVLGYTCLVSMIYASFVIISILKMCSECQLPNGIPQTKTSTTWITYLRDNKAGPMAILVIALLLFASGVHGSVVSFTVLTEKSCNIFQKFGAAVFVTSYSALYMLFEIRSKAVGGTLTGMKLWIFKSVQIGTRMGLFGALGAVLLTQGHYLSETSTCVTMVPVVASIAMLIGDTGLSIGHLLVFLFLIKRQYSFRVSIAPLPSKKSKTINSIQSHAGKESNTVIAQSGIDECDLNKRLQQIARRNFQLSLVALTSTFVTFSLTTAITILFSGLPKEAHRLFDYTRTLQLLVAELDLQVNFFVALSLTNKWKPRKLRALLKRAQQNGQNNTSVMARAIGRGLIWQNKIEPILETEVSAFGGSSVDET